MTGNTTAAIIGLGAIAASLLVALVVFAILAARIESGYRRYSAERFPTLPQQRTAPTAESAESTTETQRVPAVA